MVTIVTIRGRFDEISSAVGVGAPNISISHNHRNTLQVNFGPNSALIKTFKSCPCGSGKSEQFCDC
jgi:hypothetical protein